MPGYTKAQLEARGAKLANYVLCTNCSLYWHKRIFQKHLNVPPPSDSDGDFEIIHPAWANFIDFLSEVAIKQWMKDRDDRIAQGESFVAPPPHEEPPATSRKKTMTVDEAAAHFGVPREEILHELEKRMIPFEFTVPTPSRRRTKRS